jgi:hypothetical protein
MPTLLKKCGSTQKTVGFACAVIYLFAAFSLPLTHTCHFHRSSLSTCDFNRYHRPGCGEAHAVGDTEHPSRPKGPNSEFLSYGDQCAACVYSTTSIATAVQRRVALSTPHVPDTVGSSHSAIPLKRPEWTCSIVLRAPPFATS